MSIKTSKQIEIITGEGIAKANCIAEFTHTVGDREYNFLVTQRFDELSKSVTHRESGYRVCALAVSAGDLKLYRVAHNDIERAKICIDAIVKRAGVNRVCVVIDSAPLLPKYKAATLNAERSKVQS